MGSPRYSIKLEYLAEYSRVGRSCKGRSYAGAVCDRGAVFGDNDNNNITDNNKHACAGATVSFTHLLNKSPIGTHSPRHLV